MVRLQSSRLPDPRLPHRGQQFVPVLVCLGKDRVVAQLDVSLKRMLLLDPIISSIALFFNYPHEFILHVTIPLQSIEEMAEHKLSALAIEEFARAAAGQTRA